MENEKLDIRILNEMYEKGLLHKQFHPTYPLIIWNYSPRVQYEKLWTPLLMMCRGLVTDFDGNIKARSFPKFFNYEEHTTEEIPNESFEVFDKMDGSLGILFHYNDEWILSTRGSFTSPQSIKGTELLKKYPLDILDIKNTYLFEIIFNENRIVVSYGEYEGLILLGAIDTKTDVEIDRSVLEKLNGFELVKKYNGIDDYNTLKNIIPNDAEGFVIRFMSGFRMKIKGDEYIRLHRILTNISNRVIWEYLKEGKPFDELLEKVPDEFYNWVKTTKENLEFQFNEIKTTIEKEFKLLINKKEFAEKVMNNPKKHFLFKRLDSFSKDYLDKIWDSIYPNYSTPFKKETNENK